MPPPSATSALDLHSPNLPRTQIDPVLAQTPLPVSLAPERCQIPGYEIFDVLGHGGMGVVYKARQVGLNRVVALKMVLAGRHADAEERARFRLEAEAVAALKHPNIVQVYEIGEHDGSPYFSLEYVDGGTLARRIDGQPQSPRFAAEVVEQLARAIHAAHDQNIIHRDLKPANVLLAGATPEHPSSATGLLPLTPKITDFGLAKRLDSDTDLTATGIVAGTPQYMAPEQVTGVRDAVGPSVDIYALGVILYELLTGRPPFIAPNQAETLHRVMHDVPSSPRVSQPEVPRDLETICLKCLEKSSQRRYRTAAELADDLARYLNHEPIVARPVGSVERGWRWCRRNPKLAASLLAVFVTLGLGVAVSTFFAVRSAEHASDAEWSAEQYRIQKITAEKNAGLFAGQKAIAEANAADARTAQKDADAARAEETRLKQAALDREQTRVRELFAAHMTVAQRAWDEGNVKRLGHLLSRYVPASPADPDLRGFEWYYLQSMRTKHRLEIMQPGGGARLFGSADGRRAIWAGLGDARIETFGAAPVMLDYPYQEGIDLAAFSPDGRYLATVNRQNMVQIRDARSGRILVTRPFPGDCALCIQFSGDGQFLAVGGGGDDATNPRSSRCVVWRVGTWEEDFQFPPFDCPYIVSLAFTRNSSRLVVVGNWDQVHEWDVATGEMIRRSLPGEPHQVAASHTRDMLAISDRRSGVVRILNSRTWQVLRVMTGPTVTNWSLVFAPDGVTLAGGARDGSIWLWNAETGELITRFRGHQGEISGLAFDRDHPFMYSASQDMHSYGWPLDDALDYRVVAPQYQYAVQHLLPMVGRDLLPCVHRGGDVGLINLQTFRWQPVSIGNRAFPVAAAAVWKDKLEVFLLGQHGDAKVVSLTTGTSRPLPLPGLEPFPVHGRTTPDGTALVTAHTIEKPVPKGEPVREGVVQFHRLTGATPPVTLRGLAVVTDIAVRPDGKQFVVAEATGTVRVFNETGTERFSCGRVLPNTAVRLAYAPDGSALAVSGYPPDSLKLWDATAGKPLRTFEGLPGQVTGIEFTPDGRRLAVWSDRTIALRDVESGMDTLSVQAPCAVDCLAFTTDSCGMVSTEGSEVRYWDGRRAFFSEWIRRTWGSFDLRDLTVDKTVSARQPLTVRFALANVSGHAFRLPPKEWLPEPPVFAYRLQAVEPRVVNGEEVLRVPYSEYRYVPMTKDVPADGKIEVEVVIPTASWPPGRYYLSILGPPDGPAGPQPRVQRINFELK